MGKLLKFNILISTFIFIVSHFDLCDYHLLMPIQALLVLYVYGRLLYIQLSKFEGLSIMLFVTLGYVMRLVIPSLSHTYEILNGEDIFFGEGNKITASVLPAVAGMNIYMSIFLYFLNKYSYKAYLEPIIKKYILKYNVSLISFICFVFGVAYNVISSFIVVGVIPFWATVILSNLSSLAILLQILNTLLDYKKSKSILFHCYILISIYIYTFYGFYKTPIMMTICFYLMYLFLESRYTGTNLFNKKIIITSALAFASLVFIIYPFISTKRVVSGWDVTLGGITTNSYSNVDILIDVLTGNTKEEIETSTSDRLDSTKPNAFFYQYVRQTGHSLIFLKDGLIGIIPRFIYPDKGISSSGYMATAIIQHGTPKMSDSVYSNTSMGQFASSYMIGGLLGVFLFAIINGVFYAKYWIFLINNVSNVFACLFFVELLMGSINAYEEVNSAGLPSLLLYMCYIFLIKITNLIFKVKTHI